MTDIKACSDEELNDWIETLRRTASMEVIISIPYSYDEILQELFRRVEERSKGK